MSKYVRYRAKSNTHAQIYVDGKDFNACLKTVIEAWGLKMKDPMPRGFSIELVEAPPEAQD